MKFKKVVSSIVACALSLGMVFTSFASDTDLKAPSYDPNWGTNLPNKIGTTKTVTETHDSISLDLVRSTEAAGKNFLLFFQLDMLYLTANIQEPGAHPKHWDSTAKISRQGVANWVQGFYDRDGNQLAVKDGYLPDITEGYLNSIKPGEVILTVVLKKNHPIGPLVRLERESYWEKINSNVYGPGTTTTLSEDLKYGVATTDSYQFAKTVGTTQGIKVGGQLGADKGGAKGGLSAEYSYTMTNTVTNTINHSRTIVNENVSKISVSDKNESDHTKAIGLYHPVERFSQKVLPPVENPTKDDEAVMRKFNTAHGILATMDRKGRLSEGHGVFNLSLNSTYTYSYSDYVTLKSN